MTEKTLAAIDQVIEHLAGEIKSENTLHNEKAELTKALASLVEARASVKAREKARTLSNTTLG